MTKAFRCCVAAQVDADSLVLRPPHHLLDLPPEFPPTAPVAYW
jgi:hypothetical protein